MPAPGLFLTPDGGFPQPWVGAADVAKLPVTSGLVVHFDASAITQGDNTAVAAWAPVRGPEGAVLAQATAGQRPTFRTGQINGLPAVAFVAANSSNLDTGAWAASYATPNTAFIVGKMTTGGVGSAGNFFTGRTGVLNYLGQENALIQIGAGAGNQLTLAHTPDASFHIFGAVYNGASSAIYYDSATAGATGTTGVGTSADNMPGMRVGATSAGTANFFDGAIAEILFYDSLLDSTQITQVVTYLSQKYAITVASGTTFPVSVSGTVTPAGALTRQPAKLPAGTLTPTGAAVKQSTKTYAGSATPTGALARQVAKAFTGAATPTGAVALVRTRLLALAGALAPAGALARQAAKALAGTLTPAGTVTRQSGKGLAGTLTPTGALTTLRLRVLAVAGALTPTGVITRQAGKSTAGATTPTGALLRQTGKRPSGAVTPTGTAVSIRSRLLAVAGALTPTGTATRQTGKPLSGTVAPSGTATRQVGKRVTGAAIPAGALTALKVRFLALTGSLTPTGTIRRSTGKALDGAAVPTGSVVKQIAFRLLAALAPTGALTQTTAAPMAQTDLTGPTDIAVRHRAAAPLDLADRDLAGVVTDTAIHYRAGTPT